MIGLFVALAFFAGVLVGSLYVSAWSSVMRSTTRKTTQQPPPTDTAIVAGTVARETAYRPGIVSLDFVAAIAATDLPSNDRKRCRQ